MSDTKASDFKLLNHEDLEHIQDQITIMEKNDET